MSISMPTDGSPPPPQECTKDHCHHCHHLVYSCLAGTSDLGELQPAHPSGSGRPARRHQGPPQQEQGGRIAPASLSGPVAGLGHGAEVVISVLEDFLQAEHMNLGAEQEKYRNTFATKLLHKGAHPTTPAHAQCRTAQRFSVFMIRKTAWL